MTIREKVREDIAAAQGPLLIHELPPAPCAICEIERFLRYGCCIDCATVTEVGDPRTVDYPRVGGKAS